MKTQIISFNCTLKNRTGKVISSTINRGILTHLDGQTEILPGLIRGLQNIKKGEKRQIKLTAQQAYGFYYPELVLEVPRKNIPTHLSLEVGHQVFTYDQNKQIRLFQVIGVSDKHLLLDGNHPLAGQDLIFEVEAMSARDATAQEIAESISSIEKRTLH